MSREALREALAHPNVRAFLRVIRQGESGQTDDAYTICYGGSHFAAPPWEHPRKPIKAGAWTSTAAGAYQFLAKTWDALVDAYGFEDFSPACQDEAAVALVKGRRALDDVIAGRFRDAVEKCSKEWASLPFSPYGQPTLTYELALTTYHAWGGTLEEAAPPAEEPTFNPDSLETEHYGGEPMAPIVLPLLQIAAQFIPQLAEKFGSGSEVANRNIAAAKIIGDKIVEATSSPNLQAAVERMQEDPQVLAAAKEAVAKAWPEIFEIGGGVADARKATPGSLAGDGEWWRFLVIPQFWITILLMGLVYMAMGNITGLFGFQAWTPENRSNVLFLIVGSAIGAVTGFWFGTSMSSQKKDATLLRK